MSKNHANAETLGLAIYGGGNHVFYSCGVLKYFLERGLKFNVVATYSAGGAVLPYLLDNNIDAAVENFSSLLATNPKNYYIKNLISSEAFFPHDKIYSEALNDTYKDYEFKDDIKCRVIVAEVHRSLLGGWFVGCASLVAIILYGLTRRVFGAFFLQVFKRVFDVRGHVEDFNNEKSAEELTALVLGSSTIYPFISMRRHHSRLMLDGKYSLLTPIGVLDDCEQVLSIHGHYTFPTPRKNLFQVFPMKKVRAGPMNYTSPEEITDAFHQGYAEGALHFQNIKNSSFFDVLR